MAMFNVQRAVTPKIGKSELRIMCSACHLVILYICVKFCENTSDGISYGVDKNDGSALGHPDTQNFRVYNIIPSPLFEAGHDYKWSFFYIICTFLFGYIFWVHF